MFPPRPRLRVSFWYEGEACRCELVLMDSQRGLVHRETLDVPPGSGLERVQSGLLSVAGTLARAKQIAATGGMVARSEPATVPPPAKTQELRQYSADELADERQRRAERAAAATPPEPEPEPEPELEPERYTPEQLEQHAQERQRRAGSQVETPEHEWSAETLIENHEPAPDSSSSETDETDETDET